MGDKPAENVANGSLAKQPQTTDYETVFTAAKAGMDQVDRDKVKQLVYEMSKDSAHFKNEQRKMEQTEQKIKRMKAQAETLTSAELQNYTSLADIKIAELEATRDLTRTWIHVDMDAFFASVEELQNPSLKGKAFAVGGIGMISTASYEARKYGVRSAMPGFIAKKLCPDLIFVSSSFDKYRQASQATREVFAQFDPDFEMGSLDEAYLDITEYMLSHNMSGSEVAAILRQNVVEHTRLTCSCGVAPNRMLAKVCSDKNKPDGEYVLDSTVEAVKAFVDNLEIRKIPGIGRVTEHMLKAFNIKTCSEMIEHRGLVWALFTPTAVDFFLHSALGLGQTIHSQRLGENEIGRKGISCERTFRATGNKADLEAKCREIAANLAEDMASEDLKGKTLTLKLKLATFELKTRAATLDKHIHTAEEIAAAGLRLLRAEMPAEVRLLGLRMSNFLETAKREPGQKSLDELFSKRQPQQQEQETENVVEDGGEPNTLRLSQGDIVELTLRDWEGLESHIDNENGHGGSKMVTDETRNEPNQEEEKKSNSTNDAQVKLWSCEACTFENPKSTLFCEMCGTSTTGRRPPTVTNSSEFSFDHPTKKGGGKRKHVDEHTKHKSIKAFCKPSSTTN